MENIISFVNICVKKDDNILLINRQHDHFKGWIPPGGKVIFPESFFEAAVRELEEETGLVATNLVLKGISGFTNEGAYERHVYYDFLCTAFSGSLKASREGVPKWWPITALETLQMQAEIRQRLPLYFRTGSFESINYWDNDTKKISKNSTKLYD